MTELHSGSAFNHYFYGQVTIQAVNTYNILENDIHMDAIWVIFSSCHRLMILLGMFMRLCFQLCRFLTLKYSIQILS